MRTYAIVALSAILILFTPLLVSAQTTTDDDTTTDVTTDDSTDEDVFADEGLTDDDLEVDLEAENLPTTNRFGFWWENFRDNAISAFTFNAERKAEQYEERLHRLDRKLAACAEIGDDECVSRIEKRIAGLTERTEKYIAKQEELSADHLERFQEWRDQREARIEERHERAEELSAEQEELQAEREENREEAIANREQAREERQELRQENRAERQEQRSDRREDQQENLEQRQLNREQLIETRSQNAADRLQNARQRAADRQAGLDDALDDTE